MSSSDFVISTHVLDTNRGRPVLDLTVKLFKLSNANEWVLIKEGKTAGTGRFSHSVEDVTENSIGAYKLNFSIKDYYLAINAKTIYPFIDVVFDVEKPEHYHMPVLLNSFGFTTYRGS